MKRNASKKQTRKKKMKRNASKEKSWKMTENQKQPKIKNNIKKSKQRILKRGLQGVSWTRPMSGLEEVKEKMYTILFLKPTIRAKMITYFTVAVVCFQIHKIRIFCCPVIKWFLDK